jgi:hypothetical protein
MVECQEISHIIPMRMHAADTTTAGQYQGGVAVVAIGVLRTDAASAEVMAGLISMEAACSAKPDQRIFQNAEPVPRNRDALRLLVAWVTHFEISPLPSTALV